MLKNKKILFFSLFLIAFILFLSTNVYATIDFEKDGVQYSYPDIPNNDNGISLILRYGSSGTDMLNCNYSLESILTQLGYSTDNLSQYRLFFTNSNNCFSIAIFTYSNGNYNLIFNGNDDNYNSMLGNMRSNLLTVYELRRFVMGC